MKLIKVKSEHDYQVQIGINASEKIKEISASHNKVLLIAPKSLISKFKIKSKSNLKVFGIADGENQKSLATLDRVWKQCSIEGIKRSDAVIGLGGGATTDLAGFAAATWMRGVNWYAIPTSLAGMVDASVGGKTGINSIFGKNLIGAFHSPKQVFVDLSFLAKLIACPGLLKLTFLYFGPGNCCSMLAVLRLIGALSKNTAQIPSLARTCSER